MQSSDRGTPRRWGRNTSIIGLGRVGILSLFAAFLIGGCTASQQNVRETGSVQEGNSWRVAVLPLEESDNGQNEVATAFRRELFAGLQDSSYRLIELDHVDEALAKMGISDPEALREMLSKSPQMFKEALGADVVVRTRITAWNLTYLAIQSEIKLEVECALVDLSSGKELMSVTRALSKVSGISKIPTGLIEAGASPVMGLTPAVQREVINRLASDMAVILSGGKLEEKQEPKLEEKQGLKQEKTIG